MPVVGERKRLIYVKEITFHPSLTSVSLQRVLSSLNETFINLRSKTLHFLFSSLRQVEHYDMNRNFSVFAVGNCIYVLSQIYVKTS